MGDITQLYELIDKINSGELKVRYDSWNFSGGRDYGDWDAFKLYDKNDACCGFIDLNVSFNDAEFELDDIIPQDTVSGISDTDYNWIADYLVKALERDDKEFVEACTVDGELYFPRDYCDISREDVLNGTYDIKRQVLDSMEGKEI